MVGVRAAGDAGATSEYGWIVALCSAGCYATCTKATHIPFINSMHSVGMCQTPECRNKIVGLR